MSKDFDYVITPVETDKGRKWNCYIQGREDVSCTAFSPVQALTGVNAQLWEASFNQKRRLEKCHSKLTRAIRAKAGIPTWAQGLPKWMLGEWKLSERNRLRDVMTVIISRVTDGKSDMKYEEITEAALKEFENAC